MLLVLLLVSLYMGLHWAELTQVVPGSSEAASQLQLVGQMFWPLQCLQAFLVVLCGIWLGHGLHSGVDHLMEGRLDQYLRSGGGE